MRMPDLRYQAQPPHHGVPASSEGISFLAILGAARRRKRLIFSTLLLINASVIWAALSLEPRYTATAILMIDSASPRVLEGGTSVKAAPPSNSDLSLIPTQINLLKSPALAFRVITALGMEKDPEVSPKPSPLTRLRHWFHSPPTAPALTDAEASIPGFLERLSVSRQPESLMIAVSYRSADPNKAARVANAVAHEYMKGQINSRLEILRRAYQWASGRVTELRRQLQDAEAKVTDYIIANGLPRVGGSTAPDAQQPPSLRRELAAARAERAAKDARLVQLRDLEARGSSYEALPEVAGSVIIQSLQQQAALLRAQEAQAEAIYGASHPTLREVRAQRNSVGRRINAETVNVVRGIVDDVARARDRERQLEQELGASLKEYVVSEAASVRLNELTRAVDAKSELYRTLLARLEEIGEHRDLVSPGAEVVAAASAPQRADQSRPGLLLGAGFAGSLLLALGLASLAEHLDHGMRGARDVERALGLPNLALVPKLKHGSRFGRPHSYVFDHPQSAYAEAIRALMLGIEQVASPTPKVLVVASAWPREGKTTLAISLAAANARRGRRTVVVDLDLRNPSVARQLGLQVRAGVVELVAGQCSLKDALHVAPEDRRLHIIPVRAPLANPAEVLDSPRLQELINALRLNYDTVILDVPPALGLTDGQIVGMLADAAVFVARWGSTSDSAALNGMAMLERAGISVIGCALTQVDLKRHALYGYHDAGEFYRTCRGYFRE